ncbi:MAG: universal stress protein [Acidobacteria bacterium]|nr:universal stress protein [Acidobacteriota bacterium]
MPLKHVVVPVDFSEKSEGAARYAEALCKRFGCSISLLHVLAPPHYEVGAMEVGGSVLDELYRNRTGQARLDLDAFLASEIGIASAERLLVEGDPATQIVKLAHERGAGLIVMPTHGYGTFRRFILGSVTAKVLHDADCPVWTGVHLEAHSPEEVRFERVAVAIDLGPQSERALMWGKRFADSAGAQLTVLHATPNLEGRAGDYFDPDWRRHVEASVRDEVGALLARLEMTAPLMVDSGEPSETVCDLAREGNADVLVIGRGSAAGVFGRLRANAYSIIRQSHCPVVSV